MKDSNFSRFISTSRNTLFELVFLISSENNYMSKLATLTVLIESIQVISFAANTYFFPPILIEILEYFSLPWPVNQISFYFVSAVVLANFFMIVWLCYQATSRQGIKSLWAVKLIRFMMGLLSTVFFFPYIETLLFVFHKGPDHLYEDRQFDYFTTNPAGSVVSVICLAIFYIPVLAFCFLCIVPNPREQTELTAKVSTRTDILDLVCRTGLVVLFSVTDNQLVHAVTFLLFSLAISATSFIYPYYANWKMCLIKSFNNGTNVLFGMLGLIAFCVKDESFLVFKVSLGLFFPIGFLFAYLTYKRVQLLNPLAYKETEELPEFFMNRFILPSDYEIASRFCIKSSALKDLFLAEKIYEKGIRKFPKSRTLQTNYVIFLVYVLKDVLEELKDGRIKNNPELETINLEKKILKNKKQIQTIIQRMFAKSAPPLDIYYIFFTLITKLDQQKTAEEIGEDKVNIIDSIRYKHDYKAAKYHHKRSNEAVVTIWKICGMKQIIPSELVDIYESEVKLAESYYQRLISNFPKSDLVFTSYLSFLADIQKEQKYIEEINTARQTKLALLEKESKEIGDLIFMSRNSIYEQAVEEHQSNIYDVLVNNMGNRINQSNEKKWHHQVNRLQMFSWISLIILLIGLTFCYVYSSQVFLLFSSIDIISVATCQLAAIEARALEMNNTQASFNYHQQRIEELGAETNQIIISLAELIGQNNYKEVEEDWILRDIPTIIRAPDGTVIQSMQSVSSIHQMFIGNCLKFGSRHSNEDFHLDSDWNFIMDNTNVIFDEIWDFTNILTNHNKKEDEKNQTILIICFSIAASIPILFALMTITPSYLQVAKEREFVYDLFRLFPDEGIETISNRHLLNLRRLKNNFGTLNKSEGDFSVKTSLSSINEFETKFSRDTESKYRKNTEPLVKKVWFQLILVFFFSFLFSFGISSVCASLPLQLSNQLHYSSIEINYAAGRQSMLYRTLFLMQEYIRKDAQIWDSFDDLKQDLQETIDFALLLHESVKYGNLTMELNGYVGRYDQLDSLLFDRQCQQESIDCLSMDEMYLTYFSNAQMLISMNQTLTFDNSLYQEIVHLTNGPLFSLLQQSTDILNQEADQAVNYTNAGVTLAFVLSFPLLLLEWLILKYFFQMTIDNIEGTKRLLKMMPLEFWNGIVPIRAYLKNASIKKDSETVSQGDEEEQVEQLKIKNEANVKADIEKKLKKNNAISKNNVQIHFSTELVEIPNKEEPADDEEEDLAEPFIEEEEKEKNVTKETANLNLEK